MLYTHCMPQIEACGRLNIIKKIKNIKKNIKNVKDVGDGMGGIKYSRL